MKPLVLDLDDVPADFLRDELEDGRAYRAYRAAQIEGFDCRCLHVSHEGRELVAPYFVMDFRLNTMLPDGRLKSALQWAHFKVACVGNPLGEHCRFEGEATAPILKAINDYLEAKAPIIAYKGFGGDLQLPNFVRVNGLPIAELELSPSYWEDMSYAKRRNLRRKLKLADGIKVVEVDQPPPTLAEDLFKLYEETYERAPVKFEKLNPNYFIETSAISKYLLFYEGDDLVGFVQMFKKNNKLGLYYGGMNYSRTEKYGLYFVLFLKAIEVALRDGCTEVSCGITTYEFKKFLGCKLRPTYVYYKHRNRLMNLLLGRLSFLLEPSPRDLA